MTVGNVGDDEREGAASARTRQTPPHSPSIYPPFFPEDIADIF
jgi:hypothetical protein